MSEVQYKVKIKGIQGEFIGTVSEAVDYIKEISKKQLKVEATMDEIEEEE